MTDSDLSWAADAADSNTNDDNDICKFDINPTAWESEHDLPPSGGGKWECDENSLEKSRFCKYHASKQSLEDHDKKENKVFCDLIESNSKILGAQFEQVSLSGQELDLDPYDTYKILSPCIHHFEYKNGKINGEFEFRNAIFGDIKLKQCSIESKISLSECRITGRTEFIHSEWRRSFEVSDTKFEGPVYMNETTFERGFDFSDFKMQSDLCIHECTIKEEALLKSTPALETVFITDSTVHGLDFHVTDFTTSLICLYDSILIDGCLRQPYRDARPQSVIAEDESQTHLLQDRSDLSPDRYLNIEENNFELADLLYDLKQAKLIDTKIQTNQHSLVNYRFYNTTLSDFDFVYHRGNLSQINWDLHKLNPEFSSYSDYVPQPTTGIESTPPSPEYPRVPHLRNHQETYIPATRGAELQGDNISASKFFTRESRARKLINRRQIINPNDRRDVLPFGYLIRYLKYWLLQYSCNFGESPGRTIGWSLFIIGISTLLYPYFGIENGSSIIYDASDTTLSTTLSQSLYFSIVTFTTLGFGDYVPESGPAQLLAGFEAFIGSLLIALFIFTLGRTIKR